MKTELTIDFAGAPLTIETGHLAKQAHGAVLVTVGETIVMSTAVTANDAREGADFLPLTCDYQERPWAAGKIPGGFFKREARPTENETLISRMIDRPIRPLFPDGWYRETQIIATVISKDDVHPSDVLAITASSAALYISKIPFTTPVAGVRVGRVDGRFVCNPTHEQMEQSDLDLIVVGTKDAITMVEGGANFLPESVMVDGIMFGHESMQPLIQLQEQLREKVGVAKVEFDPPAPEEDTIKLISDLAGADLSNALQTREKIQRYENIDAVKKAAKAKVVEGKSDEEIASLGNVSHAFGELKYRVMRKMIMDGQRVDGRTSTQVRPIECEISRLPRTHGSAIFTRGETQAMVIVTLGTKYDEQKIEGLTYEEWRRFLLHYNFPPFSVGEAKFLRGPGRREIGHGALARRGLEGVLPSADDFPYTVRVVSDILESNGSSSMATVCGGTLALMDAGVPITQPVAGIAMGLIKEGDDYVILSDILGDEDHLGDMDFKVVGGKDGVSSIQMDIKIGGINKEIFEKALEQARVGRIHILGEMAKAIDTPRSEISEYAPRILTINIPVDRIKDVIGPGGKTIRSIVEKTGVKIDVEDDGRVLIASSDSAKANEAVALVRQYTADLEVGKYYMGRVVKIMDFGAFVEVLPGQEGLVHISQLANERVNKVEDICKEGDTFLVQVLDIDRTGRVRLSRKAALGVNPDDVLD